MAKYSLSREAVHDIFEIAKFTIERFGINQSKKYKVQMEQCFNTLADNPYFGRDSSMFSEGLRRFPFKAHMIFYKIHDEKRVIIVRVLGKNMDFLRHFPEH
jgi:toxin ParE1/3/4